MDTFVAMQKIFRLRALVRDSPLSSGSDVLVKPTKEPQSEVTPQNIRTYPSWGSFETESADSKLVKPLHQATIPLRKSLLRSLSEYPSLRRRMLPPRPKDEHHPEKAAVPNRRREERTLSMFGVDMPDRPRRKNTLWTDDDQFLPRMNPLPLPPLNGVKHKRNVSGHSALPDQTMYDRPSTSHCGPFGQSDARPSLSPRRSFDGPTLGMSDKERVQLVPDVQKTATVRKARSSEASAQELAFPPCDDWQPPRNWAGPSKVAPADEGSRSGLIGWFIRKKGVDGAKGASIGMPTRLNRTRSLKKLKLTQVVLKTQEEDNSSPHGRALPPGVMVRTRCFEGDGWHEKPMEDIIPKLRQLKVK